MFTLIGDEVPARRDFLRWLGRGVVGGGLSSLFLGGRSVRAADRTLPSVDRTKDVTIDEGFWRTVRAQFPLTRERVYFNNGGLGPSPFQVIDAVQAATRRLEEISETGHEELEAIRRRVATFLAASPQEIAFTRNTTEGMNLIARGLPLRRGDEVLMSTHEHVGGAMPWLALMKERGIRIRLFEPGRTAQENLGAIEKALTPRTKVLSLSHMTCTVGTLFPAREIAELCHSRGVLVVLDGAHPPGQVRVNLHDLGCDFYATSGHKWLLGPKGTGILYVKQDMHDIWTPTNVGAYSASVYDLDELRLEYLDEARCVEYGTRNVALVHGLGAAVQFLDTIGIERIEARDRYLAGHLLRLLQDMPGLEVLTPTEDRSRGGIVSFRPKTKAYQDLKDELIRAGFRVRPVGEHRLGAIRVSCHVYTLMDDVERFALQLRKLLGA